MDAFFEAYVDSGPRHQELLRPGEWLSWPSGAGIVEVGRMK